MSNSRAFDQLLHGVLAGKVDRREMMKRAAALGLSASTVSTLSLAAVAVPGTGSFARAQDATPEPTAAPTEAPTPEPTAPPAPTDPPTASPDTDPSGSTEP